MPLSIFYWLSLDEERVGRAEMIVTNERGALSNRYTE